MHSQDIENLRLKLKKICLEEFEYFNSIGIAVVIEEDVLDVLEREVMSAREEEQEEFFQPYPFPTVWNKRELGIK